MYPGGKVVPPPKPEPEPTPPDPADVARAERFIEIPSNTEAQKLVISARRKLSDLPELPRTMNAVSVVLSYTLFGLTDTEIAINTGMTEEQIGRVKMNEAYSIMHESVVQSILQAETDTVRTIFQQHARNAALELVDGMKNGARAERMSAAKDLLDRAGHRPADVVEHRHRMEAGLTIEVVRKDTTNLPPVIDLEPE